MPVPAKTYARSFGNVSTSLSTRYSIEAVDASERVHKALGRQAADVLYEIVSGLWDEAERRALGGIEGEVRA